MKNFIEIKNGYLRIPINISEKRLFSKDNFFSLVNKKNISKVGGNIIDINNKKFIETLKNINIKINEGDRIAIVGHNGAGKSTLLKVLAGVYPLTIGELQYNGKISSFLEVGVGLSPESSAIDYLTYQTVIRGLNKKESNKFIKSVLEFIELGEFAELPIQTYSTGMATRLFASTALFFPSEILLLDEGIGAGDQFFTEKFEKKMKEYFKSAKILVFASHNLNLLQKWCRTGIVLEKGSIVFSGLLIDCLKYYEAKQ